MSERWRNNDMGTKSNAENKRCSLPFIKFESIPQNKTTQPRKAKRQKKAAEPSHQFQLHLLKEDIEDFQDTESQCNDDNKSLWQQFDDLQKRLAMIQDALQCKDIRPRDVSGKRSQSRNQIASDEKEEQLQLKEAMVMSLTMENEKLQNQVAVQKADIAELERVVREQELQISNLKQSLQQMGEEREKIQSEILQSSTKPPTRDIGTMTEPFQVNEQELLCMVQKLENEVKEVNGREVESSASVEDNVMPSATQLEAQLEHLKDEERSRIQRLERHLVQVYQELNVARIVFHRGLT